MSDPATLPPTATSFFALCAARFQPSEEQRIDALTQEMFNNTVIPAIEAQKFVDSWQLWIEMKTAAQTWTISNYRQLRDGDVGALYTKLVGLYESLSLQLPPSEPSPMMSQWTVEAEVRSRVLQFYEELKRQGYGDFPADVKEALINSFIESSATI